MVNKNLAFAINLLEVLASEAQFAHTKPPMIPFEQIDERLALIGKDRKWLAEETGRSEGSIRAALAPNSVPKNRTTLLQIALSQAIEREEQSRKEPPVLPDRITVEAPADNVMLWSRLAAAKGVSVHDWMVEQLNRAADQWKPPIPITPFQPVSAVADDIAEYKVTTSPRFTVPLLRAAAGIPILADAEMIEHYRDLGTGRFLLELRGDSMEPVFQDRQRVVMRDKTTLKRPVLKYRELYAFVHEGELTFKQWEKDGNGNKVLRSLNENHPDIIADESIDWIGWYDPKDNE